MIVDIIGYILAYLIFGFFSTIVTSSPSGNNDDSRFCFSVFAWPIAIVIRIVKLFVFIGKHIYIGFKEELHDFEK